MKAFRSIHVADLHLGYSQHGLEARREDGSIGRLAEATSRFKAVQQIIAVTYSEAFSEKAEHIIRLEKEAGESKVSVER